MAKRANGEWLRFLQGAARAETDECIECGGKHRPTYRGQHAARFVYILANGDPGNLFVLHTCDNKLCVNVRHLYAGTQSRNSFDAFERNRRDHVAYVKGEAHARSKLTSEDVKWIRGKRAAGWSQQEIADSLGKVSQVQVGNILRGISWKGVGLEE